MNAASRVAVVVVVLCVGSAATGQTTDDLIFIHHSCGGNWLRNSLNAALLDKDYLDERNDITYRTVVAPDADRPDSLGPTAGNLTNMNHWVMWFNDYLGSVKTYGCGDGVNRVIMFKSCYPTSNIQSDGTEPGDPFSTQKSLVNYKAVYRHPDGPGNVYFHGGYTYWPLEDVFAGNPDTLFIAVTAPPLHYAPTDATNNANAHRARIFNNWLKTEWLAGYNAAHPELNNVVVFDWFDVLAYPDDHATHPNRLRAEYGGESGDSHPSGSANAYSTQVFATNSNNVLDAAWEPFQSAAPPQRFGLTINAANAGFGTIAVDPEPDGEATDFAPGTTVTLTAYEDGHEDHYFAYWEVYDPNHPGDLDYVTTDSNRALTLVMNADWEVRAVFRCGPAGRFFLLSAIALAAGLVYRTRLC